MSQYLSSSAIQMITLLILAGLVFILTAIITIRACVKLRTKTKSISKIAADGERTKAQLERYTAELSNDYGGYV